MERVKQLQLGPLGVKRSHSYVGTIGRGGMPDRASTAIARPEHFDDVPDIKKPNDAYDSEGLHGN